MNSNKYFQSLILFVSLLFVETVALGQSSPLIGNWRQFAYKSHNSTDITTVPEDCSGKTITFGKDGYYEEEMFCLKSSGKWYFNGDKTKLGWTTDTFNGVKIPAIGDTTQRTNILIIKLNKDTLIYGTEGYYGNDKIYGHDDWYFIRQKRK